MARTSTQRNTTVTRLQARAVVTQHELMRRQRGFTVTRLAAGMDVSHAYVSRIEGQQIPASARYRAAVARLLGVSEGSLFGADGRALEASTGTEVMQSDQRPAGSSRPRPTRQRRVAP